MTENRRPEVDSLDESAAAAEMPGQVPDDVKAARAEAIMLAQRRIAFAANEARVGSEVEILVDGADAQGYCLGRSRAQAPDIDSVCILTEPRPAGAMIRAKTVDWREYDLIVDPL